jgi:hypothetical protein
LEAFDEEISGLQSILTPPPEEEDWAAIRNTITSSDFLAALEDSPTVAAAVDLFSDTESVLFEDEGLGVFVGPEIPPELVEAGIPEIEDHGAIQAHKAEYMSFSPCRRNRQSCGSGCSKIWQSRSVSKQRI